MTTIRKIAIQEFPATLFLPGGRTGTSLLDSQEVQQHTLAFLESLSSK